MSDVPFLESRLWAFFEPSFVPEGRVHLRVDEGAEGMLPDKSPPIRFHDARALQARAEAAGSFSEASFFQAHGFVLLPHESAVEDWDVDPATPESENPVLRAYRPEIEALIRKRLLPGRRVEIWQGPPTRRGPGTPNPTYANGVHQDFGVTPDDFQEGLEAFTTPEIGGGWRWRYDQEDVAGFLMIDFWRTVGMDEPLEHMPLAVCDPHSVRVEDLVPLGVLDITPTGKITNQLGLRFHPDQRWYYYPHMTTDEVLAFKNFQSFKDAPEGPVEACFHSALDNPGTPAGAAERQSCEHRVSIFILKD